MPPALAGWHPPGSAGSWFATFGAGRQAYRSVSYVLADGAAVQIAVPAARFLRTIWRARVVIAVVSAALLVALAILAWGITTRATGELARVADELETMEAGSLGRRLAPRRTTEVDRLARVIDRLHTRLEAVMGHLRRFTADAAHELRTPIAALRAHLEVALARADSPAALRDGLLDALEQTERLERLAEDLLTLSAVEANAEGLPETRVALSELAREVAESLEPVAQEQGRPFRCRAERAVLVRGSPQLLKRVLVNLIDNAFRHTPPGAPVSLSVAELDGAARIEVADRGPGIPSAELPAVFERFRRGRDANGGTGLGLALCREIVTRHHGEITVHSGNGAGTTVTVTLPLAGATPSV
jgi:two-component system sensor histidine kinase TctE